MNTPYVKKYDEQGKCTNPITKNEPYVSGPSQRKTNREPLNKIPFYGTGKNIPLTVTRTGKYLRVRQLIIDEDGNKRYIHHYRML